MKLFVIELFPISFFLSVSSCSLQGFPELADTQTKLANPRSKDNRQAYFRQYQLHLLLLELFYSPHSTFVGRCLYLRHFSPTFALTFISASGLPCVLFGWFVLSSLSYVSHRCTVTNLYCVMQFMLIMLLLKHDRYYVCKT